MQQVLRCFLSVQKGVWPDLGARTQNGVLAVQDDTQAYHR